MNAYDIDGDLPEPLPSLEALRARNWEFDRRGRERVARGRPRYRVMTVQWDQSARRMRPPTVAPDPILDLYVARDNARRSAASAERYGAIRQAVVSPLSVRLP